MFCISNHTSIYVFKWNVNTFCNSFATPPSNNYHVCIASRFWKLVNCLPIPEGNLTMHKWKQEKKFFFANISCSTNWLSCLKRHGRQGKSAIAIATYCILFDWVNCEWFKDLFHPQLMSKGFTSYFNILKSRNLSKI